MGGISKRQDASANLLGARDGASDGIARHALTIAAFGVDHQQGSGVQHGLSGLVWHQQSVAEQPNIGGQHADTVTVVAGEVRSHQMIGDFRRLGLGTTHSGGDQMSQGLQRVWGDGWHRQCAPLGWIRAG